MKARNQEVPIAAALIICITKKDGHSGTIIMRDRRMRKVTVMFKRWPIGPRLAFRKSEFAISTRLCCGKTFQAASSLMACSQSADQVQIEDALFLLDKFPITILSAGIRQKALAIAE